ncbi:LptF/LptG family permease [Helicobacter fennelliae]|uniref:Predicted permease YjgP/YjgQ family n=2 Tax=Helicobacter fennelliae TaxID=215 RepID=T1CSV7_9HELI|nr:LptF/LptG family permease [Helicobacter fennelliae]GAD19909.1 predicted permease YjgP/YjgQ family [Helicobacter fennelliae MRY12-0050]SQB98743.1 YjgP/YjgQ family permease [Helicobacter fennelliae]STP08085.1 YjgP/YjgQ family permease [Helicobacter fennelliae]STQ84007.1 YjgP/YjgQ family permease [Helicobacter fennelliae]
MIKKYLFLSISQIFTPFFIVLFFVASVVLLINLATITQFVKLNFLDLGQVFLYSIPNAVFFIIPITFFSACVLGLSRLSFDYELLVFFSLGISPKQILQSISALCVLASATLLLFSLVLIPLSKNAYSNFMAKKRAEVNINIRAGEFGQKLGDWLVYVDSAEDKHYRGLVLLSNNVESKEAFITADEGEILNQKGIFTLILKKGSAYFTQSGKMQKVDFEQMQVNTKTDEVMLSSYDLWKYWQQALTSHSQAKRLAQAIITSLFPVASIFLILVFGVANPRFHKNLSYVYLLVSVGLYFILMHIFSQNAPFIGIVALPIVWFIISYMLYRYYIFKTY